MEPFSGDIRLESRYSAKNISQDILRLTEEQKKPVRQIGFGSILDIPFESRTDRQVYLWLLSCWDTDKMVITLSEDHVSVKRVPGVTAGRNNARLSLVSGDC